MRKKPGPRMVHVWLPLVLLASALSSSPAWAQDKKDKLNPLGTLLFGGLKLNSEYKVTNTLSAGGVTGAAVLDVDISRDELYAIGIGYNNKPILSHFLQAFGKEKDQVGAATWDLLVEPIKFNARVARSRTLKAKQNVLTEDFTDKTVYSVGVAYSLPIETLVYHVGFFRKR